MPANRPRRSRALLLAALAALTGLLPALAAAEELASERIPWRELAFEGSKFGISLTAKLSLELAPTGRAVGELLPSERTSGITPAGAQVVTLRLDSEFLGRRSAVELWIEPGTAAALQRVQTESGKRQRIKSERYGEGGITSIRHRPAKGEEGLPSARWSDLRHGFEEYPAWAGQNLRISDPAALFYVVAAAALEKPGDRLQLPLFSDGDLLSLEVKVVERLRVDVDYVLTQGGSTRHRREPVDALRLSLDARTLGPGAIQHSFELAGLQGDVEMLFDPRARVPLELSGRVPWVGRVAIDLRRVVER